VRRRGLRPLSPAIDTVRTRVAPATLLAGVQRHWPEVAGERLAEEAEPVSERAGEVTMACRSSVWASELSLMADDLRARLNAAIGGPDPEAPVRGLRFVTRSARP
jgi:predicted nucleic acid-binding Zn ribbon protein